MNATETPFPISVEDQEAVRQLYETLRGGQAKLVGPDGESRTLPGSLYQFLLDLITTLTQGKSIYIVQNQAKLTTVEAAAMLGVSRQFLVGLLDKEQIPYHLVGTHRRIYAQDLIKYKTQRDGRRRGMLRGLAQAEANEGLYGKSPVE